MQKNHKKILSHLLVRARPGHRCQGLLQAGGRNLPCALGRSGIGLKRGEGDGFTPIGEFSLLSAMIRQDRARFRACNFNLDLIGEQDGWCDAVGDRNYNHPVKLPYPQSHEKLQRDDHLYDIVVVMDFNISNHMRTGGSAIFFHLAHDDYRPTEGCVAISRRHMEWLLPRIGSETVMVVR